MRRTLAFIGLLLVVALPFRGALDVGFLQDDLNAAQVLGPALKLDGPTVARLLHPPADEKDTRLRPVSYLTLLVDVAVFGLDPFALHLTGLLMHLASVAVVLALARTVWPEARAFPWLAALFFGLHPAHADAIGWLAARADPTVGLLSLAALLAHARYRLLGGGHRLVASLAFYGLALLAKEAAIVTPGLVVLLEGLLAGRRRVGKLVPALTGLAMLSVVYLLYRYHLFGVFLGRYGERQAASWAVSLDDAGVAGRKFLAAHAGGALRWVLFIVPVLLVGLAAIVRDRAVRPSAGARGLALLLAATFCALLPVIPFLDHANGRHFYVAAVPFAALVAAAASGLLRSGRRGAMVAAVGVLVYAPALGLTLRAMLARYIEAGHITAAAARDLRALHEAHPDVKLFVVGDLRRQWQEAPLLFSGFPGLAAPPFQPEPIPVVSYFHGTRRDRRWEAYMVRKPAVFLRLRVPPEPPGLEPVSPILRGPPPRRVTAGYACLEPRGGQALSPDPANTFRFRVPRGGRWPRALRIVFRFPAALGPFVLRPEHLLEEAGGPPGERTFVWRPIHGVEGQKPLALARGPLGGPVSMEWWIEEAELDFPGVRPVASSASARFVFVP